MEPNPYNETIPEKNNKSIEEESPIEAALFLDNTTFQKLNEKLPYLRFRTDRFYKNEDFGSYPIFVPVSISLEEKKEIKHAFPKILLIEKEKSNELTETKIVSSLSEAKTHERANKTQINELTNLNLKTPDLVTNSPERANNELTKPPERANKHQKRANNELTNLPKRANKIQSNELTKTDLFNVRGNEEKMLSLLQDSCRKNSCFTTLKLSIKDLQKALPEMSKKTISVVLVRLVKKKIVKREKGQLGPGGWMKFSFNKEVFQRLEIIERANNFEGNELTSEDERANKQSQASCTRVSSSSIYKYPKQIFNSSNPLLLISAPKIFEMPDEWKSIDTSSLQKLGFGENQIEQLYLKREDNKLTPKIIQDSINRVSWDIENGKCSYKNIPAGLFSNLNSGRFYVSVAEGYICPLLKAIREKTQEIKQSEACLQVEQKELDEILRKHPQFEIRGGMFAKDKETKKKSLKEKKRNGSSYKQ